jgi:hypothetical protein
MSAIGIFIYVESQISPPWRHPCGALKPLLQRGRDGRKQPGWPPGQVRWTAAAAQYWPSLQDRRAPANLMAPESGARDRPKIRYKFIL